MKRKNRKLGVERCELEIVENEGIGKAERKKEKKRNEI